jgi:hypothetical protein
MGTWSPRDGSPAEEASPARLDHSGLTSERAELGLRLSSSEKPGLQASPSGPRQGSRASWRFRASGGTGAAVKGFLVRRAGTAPPTNARFIPSSLKIPSGTRAARSEAPEGPCRRLGWMSVSGLPGRAREPRPEASGKPGRRRPERKPLRKVSGSLFHHSIWTGREPVVHQLAWGLLRGTSSGPGEEVGEDSHLLCHDRKIQIP